MSNIYRSKTNIKFKKLRNRDSYMCAFLERRKKAADFALTDKNRVGYEYDKPFYILKNEEELMELKKKNRKQMNSIRNKTEFYKTYKTLKNSIAQKGSKHSTTNKVLIEKENNKYYLSQDLLEKQRDNKTLDKKSEKFDNDIDFNKKFNNIKHHTINVSSKSKKYLDVDNSSKRNGSWKNLQIQKTSSINNYEILDDNKKENEIESTPGPYLVMSNEYECFIKSQRNNKQDKQDKQSKSNTKENDINKIIEKYKNDNIIYEASHNYKYYESSPKINDSEQDCIYKYDAYKPKNLSEPKNLYEKTKNIYSLKEKKPNNKILNNANNLNFNYCSKINEISPIKTNFQYDIRDNKEHNKDIDKIYVNHTLNSNGNSKSDTNIKLRNNLKSVNNNDKANENQDLNLGYYKDDKSQNLYNIQNTNDENEEKLKNVGILYKNKKYYIDDNLNNLEIPLINNNEVNKKELNNNLKMDNDNNIYEFTKKKDNNEIKLKKENINQEYKYQEDNNKEKEIQKLNDSNNSSKDKENDINEIMTEKYINSIENKSQQINKNTNKNNFNLSKPKENNSKIKNIKAQSYKKISDENNYESIKEKFESFLKPREEKEPNIQSRVVNSLLSSKEDLNNNNMGNHNKSLVRSIQEKIKILKNNKSQNLVKEYNNYINEIDECYTKIKLKEEKDNRNLEKYYTELLQKENDLENEERNKTKELERKKEKEKEKDISSKNENKKYIIQKSKRLEYIMRNLLNNKKYNYYDYHYLSNKLNKTKIKNKENIDINNLQYLGNSAPDINLIADQSNEEKIKIIDENDFYKLRKNNNLRSVRTTYNNNKKNTLNNMNNDRRRNSDTLTNYSKYVSPRLIIKDINHKIMPPNELI